MREFEWLPSDMYGLDLNEDIVIISFCEIYKSYIYSKNIYEVIGLLIDSPILRYTRKNKKQKKTALS